MLLSGSWTIYRRELAGLFLGPLAYVLLGLALFVNGQYFTVYLKEVSGEVTDALTLSGGVSVVYWILMVVLPPLVTMRMVSEESRSGMLELLLTSPVSDAAVVAGKLVAAVTFMAVLWSSNLFYGLLCHFLGTAPDWPALLVMFAGSVLVSALLCAIGLCCSAATSTPILAAFLGLVANVVLLSVPYLAGQLGLGERHWLVRTLSEVDLVSRHAASFMRGVLDSRHLAFFLAWTVFFAFVTTRLIESRRWKT